MTALTLFLTFDLMVVGSFTRLTDSGLGCPDWPGCYGSASPFGAHEEIAAAHAASPGGPVSWHKAWIEMVHRYLAMTVGALIVVIAAVSWRERRRLPQSLAWSNDGKFVACEVADEDSVQIRDVVSGIAAVHRARRRERCQSRHDRR